MSENELPKPEPLESLLAGPSAGGAPIEFQQSLLRQTTRVLRRRRRWKQASYGAALAACYVAGLLTMKYVPASRNVHPDEIAHDTAQPNQVIVPPAPTPAPVEMAKNATESPLALEWQALDSKEKRPDLFRKAGDGYLEAGDVQSAVRCYRSLLDSGSDKDTAIVGDENWLLTVLKDARQKEKRREKIDG